jgi:citrate synthase
MAFPTDFFTVLFAIARTSGWLAQWEEMLLDKEQKIARPRQIYTGPAERPYRATIDHHNASGLQQKDALRA